MVSQKHNNFNWPEDETPSSATQEQTAPAASSWQDWSLWLRIIGVVVALVTPLVVPFTFPLLNITDQGAWNLYLLFTVLLGVVSAALIRSWWSVLMVPVAFDLGQALSSGLGDGFGTFALSLVWGAAVLYMVLVAIGEAIGTPLGKMIKKRLRN